MRARTGAIDEIINQLSANPSSGLIEKLKRQASGKFKLSTFIRNSEIIARAEERGLQHLIPLLRKRPMRSASGIVNLAIMSWSGCPHGRCTYCPKGENAPNSYTGFEPSTMRGIQNRFDAGAQIQARISQLTEIGHPTDKCEVIIQGGTFLAQPNHYQESFVKGMFDALNHNSSGSIDEAKRINERARHRCIGLTIETRPDWCFEKHISGMLTFGATRVELGVQTLSPKVLLRTKRGHTLDDVHKSTKLAKDSLLKICYHMMPGLYASPEDDIKMLRQLFEDGKYRPDMLKIYPLLIMKGTEIYGEWERGEVRPYASAEAADVIAEAYRYFPYYVRVMRVQRDIPAYLIDGGVKKSNLRQLVEQRMLEKGIQTGEIRHREVGLNVIKGRVRLENLSPELTAKRYSSSDGEEVFLAFEDKTQGVLFSFLRLRRPDAPFRSEITPKSAGVRELHVYGEMQPLGRRDCCSPQHQGMGKQLMSEAERIAKDEWDCNKMLVISGVGVRDYYRTLGYTLDGPYMSKPI